MNAIGCISHAKAPTHSLTRQLILSRDGRPFASEIRFTPPGHRAPPAPSSRTASAGQSHGRYGEVLAPACQSGLSLNDRNGERQKKHLNRTLICLSETSLNSFELTEALLQSGSDLRDLGHTLVVSLTAQPLWELRSKYKKNIIYNMYRLKDHGIEIALDDCNIQRDAVTSFCTLNLFNYIKLSVSSLDQCLKLKGVPEFLNKIHDRMVTLSHNHKISFIADRVEHIESHSLARALPFDYFQGSHYSHADHLLTENW